MAFFIQERKACQPLAHFKPDCVKEWEEGKRAAKKKRKPSGCDSVGSSTKKGIRVGFEKDATQTDFFYDTHLPQEWSAALIW